MSPSLKTLAEAQDYLLNYSPPKLAGEAYTLGRMKQMMANLGNPQNELKVIHVAGTSGKTSTSYFIRALLESSGKKTGLTASPHIETIAERVQIGGSPLSDSAFLAYLKEFLDKIERWKKLELTYFELLIAFAYWVFAKEKVEYAVIETGLGGLLDATNVVLQADKICVLTPIGLDHTNVLGSTLEAIAAQKSGIITPHSHVFLGSQEVAAYEVIKRAVNVNHATLHITDDTAAIPGLPLFQQANFGLAQSVHAYITQRDDLPTLSSKQLEAASHKSPPGRFEQFEKNGKKIILDGAHNPQKLAALVESLAAEGVKSADWLVGLTEAPVDKIETCLEEIKTQPSLMVTTNFQTGQDFKSRKSVPSDRLAAMATKKGINTQSIPALDQALQALLVGANPTIVITGSLYLVAEVRRLIAS